MECVINVWGYMEIFPIHPLKSHLHFFMKWSTVSVICRQIIEYWVLCGQISPLVSIYSLQSYLHIWVKKSTICVICRRIIVYWLHSGEISDPPSHSSTEIPLANLCEIVHSFGHLPSNNRRLGAFWWNIGPSFAFIYWNPTCIFYEMVYSFRHLPLNNSILAAFRWNIGPSFAFIYWNPTCPFVWNSPQFRSFAVK